MHREDAPVDERTETPPLYDIENHPSCDHWSASGVIFEDFRIGENETPN